MKQLLKLVALLAMPLGCGAMTFSVSGTDASPWKKILGSIGLEQSIPGDADIIIAGKRATANVAELAESHFVILEGTGETAASVGIKEQAQIVSVRQICDRRASDVEIIWEKAVEVHAVALPQDYKVFAVEKWKGAPVLAGKRTSHGGILWLATEPGPSGIERFPYVLQALADLGLDPQARTTNLWAFFDSAYRIRADVDYLAERWRKAGIGALHVAAWHNMEPDKMQDEYVARLIAACHRHAILVYAWLELPHVSEKFWADHPGWREQTAAGQDAQLDWRKLMNLQNPECHKAVEGEITTLLRRFDWDGVNVAELYFESLEGPTNPARFTPMNTDVRADFKALAGFDPKELFKPESPLYASKNSSGLRKFLDYRAELASRMQADWLTVIERSRKAKPYLDVVLTHIDDRFEPGIRDELGADVARSLPLMKSRRSTLLVEDPATLWDLGPERYAKLAGKYRELNTKDIPIAVDINIVDRYQDVYPTKKQTGTELFELVHQAAESFGRVALYFENSLEKQDLSLLPVAATAARVRQLSQDGLDVDATEATRIRWKGPVAVDGKLWPVGNEEEVLLPAGNHRLTSAPGRLPLRVNDFNGTLQAAVAQGDRVDIAYTSRTRAIALLINGSASVEVDGAPWKSDDSNAVMLPAGQHLVTFITTQRLN